MGKIYFVRHGESEWNVTDQICGQTDVPLTEKGHKQAEETGKNIVEAVLNGYCPRGEEIAIQIRGGVLYDTYLENGDVVMRGPAVEVFHGEWRE